MQSQSHKQSQINPFDSMQMNVTRVIMGMIVKMIVTSFFRFRMQRHGFNKSMKAKAKKHGPRHF
jgi:hypothetical protein